MATGWRYLAERRNGDGTATLLHPDIPLSGAQIGRVLSGPGSLSGTIKPEIAALIGEDGLPIFSKGSTAIWAECDGEIRGGGLLTSSTVSGPDWSIDCTGFAGYPAGQPYTGADYWVQVDPMDAARMIWGHLQQRPNGNLGVVLDETHSPMRIGTTLEQVEFDTQQGPVSFESGPYKLAWYLTSDLGSEFDDLAKLTPFDFREQPTWAGHSVHLRLEMGYPKLGTRREDLRFVVGENVMVVPSVGSNTDFANEILCLGAGEGAAKIRGSAIRQDGRLRQVRVITDTSLTSVAKCNAAAAAELRRAEDVPIITEAVILNHPHAPMGSYDVGDEILLRSDAGWESVAVWLRIVSTTISPEAGETTTVTLIRSEI